MILAQRLLVAVSQNGTRGHSSIEDAITALQLAQLKVRTVMTILDELQRKECHVMGPSVSSDVSQSVNYCTLCVLVQVQMGPAYGAEHVKQPLFADLGADTTFIGNCVECKLHASVGQVSQHAAADAQILQLDSPGCSS